MSAIRQHGRPDVWYFLGDISTHIALCLQVWLQQICTSVGRENRGACWNDLAVPLLIYSQGAFKLLHSPISSARSKHITSTHHFARERVLRQEVASSTCGLAGPGGCSCLTLV